MDYKQKIIVPSPANRATVDWNNLWSRLRSVYSFAGMDRQTAVLDNFRDQKEEICRIMNVVCEADLARVQRQITEQSNQVKGM
jgi:hypothetical protein